MPLSPWELAHWSKRLEQLKEFRFQHSRVVRFVFNLAMPSAILIDYGCHAFTFRLAEHLRAIGTPIRYFANGSLESPNRSSLPEWQQQRPDLVRILRCNQAYGKMGLRRRLLGELEWAQHCTEALEEEKPSAILLSCVPLAAVVRIQRWARAHRTPVIYWLQDLQGRAIHDLLGRKLGLPGRVLGAFAYLWEQEAMERSRMVITIAKEHVQELPASVRRERRHQLLENWVDIEKFPLYPLKNDWAVRHHLDCTRNLIYSGTLGLKHDLDVFFHLARDFSTQPDVRVVIVSGGQAADAIRARAEAQHLSNLLVLPFQPYHDVPMILASASVLIAPLDSSAGSFCVPSKVLSYFCAGRPTVIAIDESNPAAMMVRDHGAGIVVKPGDSAGFVSAVRQLINDDSARSAAGRAARRYAEATFVLGIVAKRFLNILHRSGVTLTPEINTEFPIAPLSKVVTA
jgi:colanic acid biosynthesis glycosyl transferase WcaI